MIRYSLTMAAALLIAQPVLAHSQQAPQAVAADPAVAEAAAVRSVLASYHDALERLDAKGTEQLFTADSMIFETGGSEGTYANYLAHHLGPELTEFKSFQFSDYKVDVRMLGPATALATETYKYRIETKKGEVAERLGVATSVLKKVGDQWQIISMHNSARKPKGS